MEVNTPEWDEMNQRRAELIWKKNRDLLLPGEMEEFERLQAISREVIERTFPRPMGDKLDELIKRLKGGEA